MKVNVIGGGPAGLYFAILLKKSQPAARIAVYERNRPNDTFGFGVVLSEETLGNFRAADAPTYRAIRDNFAYWDDIYVHFKGSVQRSTGHGFSGIERLTLLRILQERAAATGVEVKYQADITGLDGVADADLVIAADGVNSFVRQTLQEQFRPRIDFRPNKFVWLGSALPLPGFTFIFRENDCGIWNVHAYQFKPGLATVIVETTAEAFRRAGLADTDEARTVAYCEALLAEDLKGHRLIANRSHWRNFPIIHCATWHHRNIVLMGDAAHTAHFSIGSGTKLAMEDAIALHKAILGHRGDIPAALASYETERREEVERIQHAADVSLSWFEHVRRFWSMDPVQFNFSLLSRSKQITYENLRLRDPGVVRDVDVWFVREVAKREGTPVPNKPPPPLFTPFTLRRITLSNRVVVSPMCQYSAKDGTPNDWHFVHLGARAVGGAGLVVTEMACVSRDGRISPGCAGMYKPAHARAWRRIVRFVHAHSAARICLQLGHAGRKGSTQLGWQEMDRPLKRGNWPLIAASPIPYHPDSQVPRAMTRADMDRVRDDFVAAAKQGIACGFDMLELHMAHGYLLASFISPVTNKRSDEYGGSLENRLRFPLEVFAAVRAAWPVDKPMSVRISATDWIEDEGLTGDDAVAIARLFKAQGCDLIDVSTGQTSPDSKPIYGRMYQTPFAEQIRLEVGIATMAVGSITTADQVNTIVASGRADLCALARPHLADPHFTLRAAADYDIEDLAWPVQYLSGKQQLYALTRRAKTEAAAKQAALEAEARVTE